MARLLRGVARTAVVAGTATAVSGRVQRRQASRFAEQDAQTAVQRQEAYEQAAPPVAEAPPAAAPAATGTDDRLAQLRTLGELRDQGVLTEDEFTAQKAKILAG